jgi:hypothetical protein
MIWKTDRADRLVEGNLRRIYAAPPAEPLPGAAQLLLDRLRMALDRGNKAGQTDEITARH